MPRHRQHPPLSVYQNNRFVGVLLKEVSGAISFQYDESWLSWQHAYPISLSLPLREDAYKGEPVIAVFENLLPDSDALRQRVAEKVGAQGKDAYSLLAAIGRDCVGAFQFVIDGDRDIADGNAINGVPIDNLAIESLLNNLAQTPLGLNRDDDFRISVAGAQEKTALLWNNNQWLKPLAITPTTHIFKTQIGRLPNGIDLSNSVENEYYCLKLMAAFDLPVNKAEMKTFGETKALVIERFDRRWASDGRLLRLPQEDCCQALSVPPSRKYQSDGGPGIVNILGLLKGSDTPQEDQKTFLKAQILFWLIGATDGHAKNFSLFLSPGGGYRLTPLYDVLSAQPSLDEHQIQRKQMKMAMSVGNSRHYRIDEILIRHFIQTAEKAGLSKTLVSTTIEEILDTAKAAINSHESSLPKDFSVSLHQSVKNGLLARLDRMYLTAV